MHKFSESKHANNDIKMSSKQSHKYTPTQTHTVKQMYVLVNISYPGEIIRVDEPGLTNSLHHLTDKYSLSL